MREANAKYPGNFKLMSMLNFAIGWTKNSSSEEDRKKANEEIVELSEKILAECTDNSIRLGTIQGLCFSLSELGQKDKAIEIVNKELPGFYLTTNIMLSHLLEGDELIKHNQVNLTLFLGNTIDTMCKLARDFEPDAKLAVYENALKMYEFIYTDGDYHFNHWEIESICMDIVKICLKNKDDDKALRYIDKAKYHAIAIDSLPINTMHTSPLIYKLEYTGIWKDYTGNYCWHLSKRLKDESYDAIRNDERFKAVISELEKHARDDI